MPKLTKAARAQLLAAGTPVITGPAEDYHPTIVDELTDADGEAMVELTDGNIEPAEDWITVPETPVVALGVYDSPTGGEPVEVEFVPPRPDLPKIDRSVKPATLIHGTKTPYLSGFCSGEHRNRASADQPGASPSHLEAAVALHSRCKGGVINGVHGQVIFCQCPGHDDERRCLICRQFIHPDWYDPEFRVCTDLEACADALHAEAVASSQTPLSRMIRQVKAAGARSESAEVTGGKRRATTTPREAKEKRQGRPCQCGCALITGGGLFRPGHDAKLKGVLKKAAAAGDVEAVTELVARSWPIAPESPQAIGQHIESEAAKQEYIATRVAARYINSGEQQ